MLALFVSRFLLALAALTQAPATQPAPVALPTYPVPAEMLALAKQPPPGETGLFVDRPPTADLRVVCYNVNWDKIFPDEDRTSAEKFQRVMRCLRPDVIALQEIRDKSADDVAALLNTIAPLPQGQRWHTAKGWTNVIASRYPLHMVGDAFDPPGQRELVYALVDLPDQHFPVDLYLLNNHWKCCGGTDNDPQRQMQADAIIAWLRDARTPGDKIDLPSQTPIIVTGDFNIVGGPQPLATVVDGNIQDEDTYGADTPSDWDDSPLTDAKPTHNGKPDGETYTWRNDEDRWDPGRLDYVIYSDSVLTAVNKFVLNTTELDANTLKRLGLQKLDITIDDEGRRFDHLPLIVDFRLRGMD